MIGQTILSGEIPPDARDLSTIDFANHLLRGVWSAFLELDADGARIDVLNAVEILQRKKIDFKLTELMALTVGVIPNANASAYVRKIRESGAKSGKPGLHDLEGSSQLKKDASVVTIIDREEDSHEITLRIVKGRNAPKSELRGRFDGPALKFEIY